VQRIPLRTAGKREETGANCGYRYRRPELEAVGFATRKYCIDTPLASTTIRSGLLTLRCEVHEAVVGLERAIAGLCVRRSWDSEDLVIYFCAG